MIISRFKYTRKGALGALMDLYEEEVAFLYETIDTKVSDDLWSVVLDPNTKDEDCRSIQTICQHIIGAAKYYIALAKKGEDSAFEIAIEPTLLSSKSEFRVVLDKVLSEQLDHFEGRWDMSDDQINEIVIKTGWGSVMDPEGLLEHAVLHIMRHHRQILRFIEISKS